MEEGITNDPLRFRVGSAADVTTVFAMSVEYKDYYAILGVDKGASPADIKKAFRALARSCHPDLAKAEDKASAEARFKEINEAYEVLKDPEKRAKYDTLGSDWNRFGEAGFEPGDRPRAARGGASRGYEYHFGGTGFSDFFERFFGGSGVDPFVDLDLSGNGFGRAETGRRRVRGRDVEAEIMVTLEEAEKGATRRLSLSKRDAANGSERLDTLNVSIPVGVREGQRIRLAGQGQPSPAGGDAGDLFLKVRLAQHPFFTVKDSDLHYELRLAPWEAALGAEVIVPTLRGSAKVKVKPGSQSGRQLRLRGHGLVRPDGSRGDLLAEISIRVPERLSSEEKEQWRQLQDLSNFNPRAN